MERKVFKFDLKEIADSGDFEGYAAVFNIVDLQGDCIRPGAFARTLQHKNGRVPLLADHDPTKRAGVVYLSEDSRGLYSKGKLNLMTDVGRNVYADMRFFKEHEVKVGLSIGYDTIKESWQDGVRYLHEIRLWEVSFVTFPAQPDALLTNVKSVVPFQDLPLADEDRPWYADAAVGRVRRWASSDGTGEKDTIDWAKYRKAFLWYDSEDPENFGSYKLPIADVIDGRLYAVPRGIFAAAAALQGARGGVDIPDEDIERCKRHLERYYEKMGRDAPWAKSAKYGRVLSARNEERIRLAIQALQDAVSALNEVLSALPNEEDSGNDSSSKGHARSSGDSRNSPEIEVIKRLLNTMKGGKVA